MPKERRDPDLRIPASERRPTRFVRSNEEVLSRRSFLPKGAAKAVERLGLAQLA